MSTWTRQPQIHVMPLTAAQGSSSSDAPAPKARRIAHPANRRSADEWVTALQDSRASFLATTYSCARRPRGGDERRATSHILTPLLGCKARTPLDWTHAWAMLGEWAGAIAFPHPGARRMAASRRWSLLKTGLCRADPALPYLGAPYIRARCTLSYVCPPSRLPHTLSPRRQIVPKQGVRQRV